MYIASDIQKSRKIIGNNLRKMDGHKMSEGAIYTFACDEKRGKV